MSAVPQIQLTLALVHRSFHCEWDFGPPHLSASDTSQLFQCDVEHDGTVCGQEFATEAALRAHQ
eukprot:11390664-Heterocapsa_arctica.AAC.1